MLIDQIQVKCHYTIISNSMGSNKLSVQQQGQRLMWHCGIF